VDASPPRFEINGVGLCARALIAKFAERRFLRLFQQARLRIGVGARRVRDHRNLLG
jgi:hypothetical protein